MVMHKNVPYIRCRDGIYYFVRRVPDDVKSYYSSDCISMSLRTKSNGVAIRATKSICQRLDYYWLGLRLQKMDTPALPIHDSFIMHHGFSTYGELEEAMRKAFYERFNRDIGVSKELVVKHKSNIPIDKDGLATPSFEDILNAENDYSQWRDRDDMWMSRK